MDHRSCTDRAHYSIVSTLAEFACQLSSTQDWEDRVKNALSVLSGILPEGNIAIGAWIDGWKAICCTSADDGLALEDALRDHYELLTHKTPEQREGRVVINGMTSNEGATESSISLPLSAADRILGVLHARHGGRYTCSQDHSDALVVAASLLGTYLGVVKSEILEAHAQAAYQRERKVSQVLQQALLPPVRLDLPNHEIAAAYHASLEEAEVGGDFYDVFEIGDGWHALVMGDVSGKGLSAAVYTSMAKYMVRAYAHEDPEPKSVLKRLNEALAEFVPDETFITLFYGLLDIERNIFAYANAGHEPPVLCGADCKAMALDVTGPAVGMLAKANYSQRTMPLFPGSSIVIYTDGITDSRVGTSFFGIEGLSRVVVNRIGEGALVVADAIYNAALDHAEGRLADDAALLVVRVKNSADSSRHRDGKVNNRADTVPDLHQ